MSKPKVSVLTIGYRPGYVDTLVESLVNQTMPKDEWEWVLVDDIWELRKDAVRDHIQGRINYLHLPSKEIKEHAATATAINTGLAVAQGELVYFMADYCYPHHQCLERHWYIYQKYGPRTIISGPLVDGITMWGSSLFKIGRASCRERVYVLV